MISSRQIRAARGLLEWSGDDLADKVGITRATLSKIESELSQPQEGTLARIEDAFIKHGIEFLEGDGLRLRQQDIRVFSGKDGYRQFLDHIYVTLKNGGRIRQFFLNEKSGPSFADEYGRAHISRMALIEELDAKVLSPDGDIELPAPYVTYRWINKEDSDIVPFYVYGDYVVLPMYETSHKREWVSINSKLMAERFCKQFDKCWARAMPIKKGKSKGA